MARPPRKAVPARKAPAPREDDSLLVQSAESLGRVIGSLREQVWGGTKPAKTGGAPASRRNARKPAKKR